MIIKWERIFDVLQFTPAMVDVVFCCGAHSGVLLLVLRCLSESCDWLEKSDGVYEMINSLDGSNDERLFSLIFFYSVLLKYEKITGLLPSKCSKVRNQLLVRTLSSVNLD